MRPSKPRPGQRIATSSWSLPPRTVPSGFSFRGLPALGNQNVDPMVGTGVTVSTFTNGVVGTNAGGTILNTSYLFTQLATSGVDVINGVPQGDRTNPIFSASYNPEFPEFVNTMNKPVNFALGWEGDITVNAGVGAGGYSADIRATSQLGTGSLRIAGPHPIGDRGSRNLTDHGPGICVPGFVQIGHGGSDSQVESYEPNAGQKGNIKLNAGGNLSLVAGDIVRQLQAPQNVTINTLGPVSRTTTVLPTNTPNTNIIDLNLPNNVLTMNIGVGSTITGTGIPAGSVVTAILSEQRVQISNNTSATVPLAGNYTFSRSSLTFNDKSSPDSSDNYVMVGHGGTLERNRGRGVGEHRRSDRGKILSFRRVGATPLSR